MHVPLVFVTKYRRKATGSMIDYPPKVPVSSLVNSLKGAPARRLRQKHRVRTHREHLRSPSYLAASCGGPPLDIIRKYIENQRTPGGQTPA